uniref:hypothetical protein n=1 Tax=Agathobacter sp. TaxID=2021311 RepID=UPI0040571B05
MNYTGSSIFNKCDFVSFKLRQSSTSLNYYRDCYFFDAKISGNFFFNLLINSHFEKSNVAKELFGSNFGFSQVNLAELSIEKQHLKNIQQTCLDNKDIVGAAVIALNLEEKNYDYAVWTSIQVVIEQLKKGILIRAEQLLFLKSVINQLIEHNKISLYTILAIISLLEKINSFESNIALKKSQVIINQLRSELFDYYHKCIEQIHNDLSQICQIDEPICVKITYTEEPQISLCILLEQIMKSIGIEGPIPVRERTAVGSFIEWIQGYDNILKCIQLLISILGLNIKLHKKTSEQSASKKEKVQSVQNPESVNNTGTTNSVVFQIPESVLEQLKTTQTEQDVSKTINVFILNGVTINNNFQGYNNFNVKNIEIL